MKPKQTHDYIFIRIRVLPTKIISLFLRCINNLSFRVIKFVATFVTFIFWFLSGSSSNMKIVTFWTNFSKIPCRLKKSIIGSPNKFIFLSSQKLISDFDIVTTHIKKPVWEVIRN
jgi:hypothetical protein